jgi:hypothetical protein
MSPGTVDLFDACNRVIFSLKMDPPPREYNWETCREADSQG